MKQLFKSQFDEFEFGKYKGEALTDIIDDDPNYVDWLLENDHIEIGKSIEDQVARALGRDVL